MSEIDPAIMKMGQEAYMLCFVCHGASGEGMPYVGPPLAGSEWVSGPVENLIRMQFRGLNGPIKVKGEEWNGLMPPNAPALGSDEKIAAVLTFVRNSWGNEASVVTAEEVAAYRGELGQPMLTVADLKDPLAVKADTVVEEVSHEEDDHTHEAATETHSSSGHADSHDSHVDEEHGDTHSADDSHSGEHETTEHHEEVAVPVKYEEYSSSIPPLGILFGVWVAICITIAALGFIKNRK